MNEQVFLKIVINGKLVINDSVDNIHLQMEHYTYDTDGTKLINKFDSNEE